MIGRRQIQALKHAMRDDQDIADEREGAPEDFGPGTPLVYFVQIADDPASPIKIGCTSDTRLEQRIVDLQIGCPYRLRILATMPGGFEVEQRLHKSFDHAHVLGEWFEPTPALLALIDGLPNCVRTEAPIDIARVEQVG